MKKLFFLSVLFFSIALQAQIKDNYTELLNAYTFDGDTSLYITLKNDYRFIVQIECASLDNTDATVGFKQKIRDLDNYVYLTTDTTSATDGCSKFTINSANYYSAFSYSNTLGDTLLIELKNESVTSGTVDMSIKYYDNPR